MLGFGRKSGGERLDLSVLNQREKTLADLKAAETLGNENTVRDLRARLLVLSGGVEIDTRQPPRRNIGNLLERK